ncbi:dipeptidyl peptidase 4 [Esox lucius]|uniref:dipeptidyl peptidase 4 n=1 Tax=Esox lucius TaxID=8010 RepID=UPI0014770246|nr:dipeptidyl peptidase 4 [Esox lucius]
MNGIGRVVLVVLGFAVVITLIAVPTAIYLNEEKVNAKRTFTINDVFNSSIKARSYNMRWISDHEYLHREDGSVFLYNLIAKNNTEFLSAITFAQVAASDYLVSADRKYVAFQSNWTKIWRHSFTASYSLYDMSGSMFISPTDIPHQVQLFLWAPTGNKMAFVFENNVYLKTGPNAQAVQVTFSGTHNRILNGIPDWVYEEEMFSSNMAMWWSPGGRYLAYAEFNDTLVHSIEYSWYGEGQYPSTVVIPYPKPGTPNPLVKLFVVDTEKPSNITEVRVPSSIGASDHYLATVTWVTDKQIAVQWQKRNQKEVRLQIYDFDGNSWIENAVEKHDITSESGWVGRFSPSRPVLTPDQRLYIVKSDSKGYKHIHQLHRTGGSATAVTSGTWEVIDILKATNDAMYYSSNQFRNRPGGRNIYRITLGASPSVPQCLTCSVDEDRCQYNSAYFSHNASFFRMDCYGPGLPWYTLWDNQDVGSEFTVLENNMGLEGILSEIQMPTMRRSFIKQGEFSLWYQMTLPPGFDQSKKYPLLIDVYAGPCSQKADYRFRLDWAVYLASTEKVVVASFDGRGSGFQGDKLMHSIYGHLGTYEVEDQIMAAREFIKMGFIDKERIAIWGWSYGGYVTSMVLGAGSGVFKCGMAVAPVSKWEYYDSIYTERYMKQPSENAEFYNNSTVTARAKNFKSVQYLLVHGTADDNVHFQQAAQISKALVEEQVDFDAMWYTDKDHGLDGSANQHVYTHMSHFLLKCFA